MVGTNPHAEWICRLAIEWLLPSTKTKPTIIWLANRILYRLLIETKIKIFYFFIWLQLIGTSIINDDASKRMERVNWISVWIYSSLIWCLPACQTYCTHTYVLAKKKSQLTGIKNRHTKSDVIAMHTKSIVNACVQKNRNKTIIDDCHWTQKKSNKISHFAIRIECECELWVCISRYFDWPLILTSPLYLNES